MVWYENVLNETRKPLVDVHCSKMSAYCLFQYPEIKSSPNRFVFRYHVPASDYCRACGNQNFVIQNGSDSETVLSRSRKLEGPAEHLIGGSKKRTLLKDIL